MTWVDHLLSMGYWLEPDPGRLQAAGYALYLALAAVFALRLLWGLRAARRHGRTLLAALNLLACTVGLGTVALRLAAAPVCSARACAAAPFFLVVGLAAWETWLLPDWSALRKGWAAAWAFRADTPALAAGATGVLLAVHLAALVAATQLLNWPLWAGPLLLLTLVAPNAIARATGRPFRPTVGLNALLPAYLLAALVLGTRIALRLGWAVPWQPPLFPALTILLLYALAYQVYDAFPSAGRGLLWAVPVSLTLATLAWACWAYLTLYARGVTGSDPFCYVQMAVDVMRNGTLLHEFPLVGLARSLQIDPRPLVFVGFREPMNGLNYAASVWPGGHSALLGLAGRLGGEGAIYLATPVMGLLSVLATVGLGMALLRDLRPSLRALAASLAGLLVATSFEQLRWLVVHMADISAQLFSTLTVVLVWLAASRGRRVYAVVAGLMLALAYWTRHTQLAMALPALAALALAGAKRSHRQRALDVAAFLGAALLGALPDLAYHQQLFGSPFHPESDELALYTLRAVPQTTALLVRGWLSAQELGWLLPFLAAGAVALLRRNRAAGWVIGLWLLGLWAVQAPYASLRLRDLLPALPALALLAGYGAAWALHWLAPRRPTAAVLTALGLAGLLWLRTAPVATIPHTRAINNFGFLWATQRAQFARLATITEQGAVIGSTLNGGPIELYGERSAFLPASWSAGDLRRFLEALQRAGRPVYLLDDGAAMQAVCADVAGYAQLIPVHTLGKVPYFSLDAGSDLRDVILYRVEF